MSHLEELGSHNTPLDGVLGLLPDADVLADPRNEHELGSAGGNVLALVNTDDLKNAERDLLGLEVGNELVVAARARANEHELLVLDLAKAPAYIAQSSASTLSRLRLTKHAFHTKKPPNIIAYQLVLSPPLWWRTLL